MTIRVTSLPPPIPENPYQRILYDSLREQGFELVECRRFRAAWLSRNRHRVDVLHFHWPTPYYRHELGHPALRPLLSWVRLCLLMGRLSLARLLGYRIVWTVHEVFPHETTSRRLDRVAASALAGASDALIAHDQATLVEIERALPRGRGKVVLIPHASFDGVYPAGNERSVVRSELDVSDGAFVFLCFGHVRDYKDLDVLLSAFRAANVRDAALVVAGLPMSAAAAEMLRAAAEVDARVSLLLSYVPDERVAELFGASDVAVVSRGDGGTSGVLVLALSLGVPVIAAACPAYEELTGMGRAGWHFTPGDAASLAATMEIVARDPNAIREKAAAARALGGLTQWGDVASRTAVVLRGDGPAPGGPK